MLFLPSALHRRHKLTKMSPIIVPPDGGFQRLQELVDGLLSGQAWRMSGAPLDVVSRMLWAVSNFGARPSMTWFGNIYDSLARKDW